MKKWNVIYHRQKIKGGRDSRGQSKIGIQKPIPALLKAPAADSSDESESSEPEGLPDDPDDDEIPESVPEDQFPLAPKAKPKKGKGKEPTSKKPGTKKTITKKAATKKTSKNTIEQELKELDSSDDDS